MTTHAQEFRRALEALDIPKLKAMWGVMAPHLPQPKTDDDALIQAHYARTLADSIPAKLRCYSHCWLVERSFPSGLPQLMRAKAEQMFPRVAEAVMISLGTRSEIGRAIRPFVMKAMTDAVEDCYANGDRDPSIVRPRILEARKTTIRKLLGSASHGRIEDC